MPTAYTSVIDNTVLGMPHGATLPVGKVADAFLARCGRAFVSNLVVEWLDRGDDSAFEEYIAEKHKALGAVVSEHHRLVNQYELDGGNEAYQAAKRKAAAQHYKHYAKEAQIGSAYDAVEEHISYSISPSPSSVDLDLTDRFHRFVREQLSEGKPLSSTKNTPREFTFPETAADWYACKRRTLEARIRGLNAEIARAYDIYEHQKAWAIDIGIVGVDPKGVK